VYFLQLNAGNDDVAVAVFSGVVHIHSIVTLCLEINVV